MMWRVRSNTSRAPPLSLAFTQRTGENAFVYRDNDYHWISQDDYYQGHDTIKPDDIVHETQLGLCR